MSFLVQAEGFVLAGGRSTRMGQDKALLQLGGRSLVEIALKKIRGVAGPAARIAAARCDLAPYAAVVADLHPGCGPLGGLEAALAASNCALNVFLPVDMPLLPAPFLRWMLLRAALTGARVTIPRIRGFPQPLCAVYHRDLLSRLTASLEAGDYKVAPVMIAAADGLADVFDVELLASTDAALRGYSPLPLYRWFHNCNSPQHMAGIGNALLLSE